MFRRAPNLLFIFIALLSLGVHATVPDAPIHLGIQKDFLEENSRIQSYSGWITFKDDTKDEHGNYPPQTMSPEKLVKLTVLAYNEMLKIFDGLPLAADRRPGAMIALAEGQHIFFASSMKGPYRAYYAGKNVNPVLEQNLKNCQTVSEEAHRTGLGCGEPSVIDLRLASDVEFHSTPRLTTWLTYTTRGQEVNYEPCKTGPGRGYGCTAILKAFEIDAFWGKTPDPGDGSEWKDKFDVRDNPRTLCSS